MPSSRIAPSAGTSPASARISVVLPAPFGPTMATNSPRVEREARIAHDFARAEPHRDVAGGERAHDADPSSRRRSRKIIERKIGTPISAVTTPSLISTAEGPSRTAMSAASTSAAPASAAGQHHARRIGADRAADEMRRHQPDEADRAGDRDGRADAERDADHDQHARPRDIDAERGGGVLAERERAERAHLRARARSSSPA